MSQLSMIVPTKSTVKLANGKTGHVQVIGISLFRFPSFPLNIQLDKFIIFNVTIQTPSHWVP